MLAEEKYQGFKVCAEQDIAQLRAGLEKRILDLLPSASAAGLSSGYVDAKGRYANPFATISYYVMFVVPLVLATVYFYFLHGQELDGKSLVLRFLVISPMLAISSFGLWSIRLNRRLYEEYNYKQRVMQLYDGFSRVVDEDGSEEQKEALIDVMIDAVKEKPSLMMSKYDRGGISLIDKLAGSTNHQDNSAKE